MIRCPWHEDTTPSCSVDVDRGVWVCFGCQRSGLLYDLARACGCSVKDSLNRDTVLDALGLRTASLSAQRMMLPTRAVHNSEQIHKMWEHVKPTPFGLGYAKSRVDWKILVAFGVDYMCGLVLFRGWAGAYGYWSEELAQVREAYPDGRYYSAPGDPVARSFGLRMVFAPSPSWVGAHPQGRHLVLVEGPFDALAVIQAVGLEYMSAQDLYVAATCGPSLPEAHPDFGATWSIFDNDAAGRKLVTDAPWAIPIEIPGDDPAAVDRDLLGGCVKRAIGEGTYERANA